MYLYIFQLLECAWTTRGVIAYKLELLETLKGVHDIFHVSNIRKCLADPSKALPLEDAQVSEHMNFTEKTIKIVDFQERKLITAVVSLVLVQWQGKVGPEKTWELAKDVKAKYPHLF
jgi:hypothetical protein